jgi:hypothetical protein
MHCIHKKPFELDDFSHEHLDTGGLLLLDTTIEYLNENRKVFLETKDKASWWNMIQTLPSSYNQRRAWSLNYEVASAIIRQRRNHKLDEWVKLCEIFLKELPYLREIMGMEDADAKEE